MRLEVPKTHQCNMLLYFNHLFHSMNPQTSLQTSLNLKKPMKDLAWELLRQRKQKTKQNIKLKMNTYKPFLLLPSNQKPCLFPPLMFSRTSASESTYISNFAIQPNSVKCYFKYPIFLLLSVSVLKKQHKMKDCIMNWQQYFILAKTKIKISVSPDIKGGFL